MFPTAYATLPSSDPAQPPAHVHGNGVHLYRPHATISNFVQDGIVSDWDAAARAVEHAFQDRLRIKSLDEFPLLSTEPSWNTKENKEKMVELAFETWQAPAYYAVDKAVMSAYVPDSLSLSLPPLVPVLRTLGLPFRSDAPFPRPQFRGGQGLGPHRRHRRRADDHHAGLRWLRPAQRCAPVRAAAGGLHPS